MKKTRRTSRKERRPVVNSAALDPDVWFFSHSPGVAAEKTDSPLDLPQKSSWPIQQDASVCVK